MSRHSILLGYYDSGLSSWILHAKERPWFFYYFYYIRTRFLLLHAVGLKDADNDLQRISSREQMGWEQANEMMQLLRLNC